MKRIFILFTLVSLSFSVKAQTANDTDEKRNSIKYVTGQGLQFNFDEGNYQFGIGGFFQPFYSSERFDTLQAFNRMTLERARLDFYGIAKKERLSFNLKMDYTDNFALFDAYIGYHPGNFNIYMGQKHNKVNNREMNSDEGYLTFLERSLISTSFSRTGREFGIFVEPVFTVGGIVVKPIASITSGDGRNAFGANSTDRIKGGFKYSGRIDILPFGEFTKNGDQFIQDLERESDLKMAIGAAISRNVGATNAVGEGSGDFILYNDDLEEDGADYDKLYVDVLVKYRGLSILGEFVSTRAYSDKEIFTEIGLPITDETIATYYALGEGYNFQVGYVFDFGLTIDGRYTAIDPEFKQANAIVQEQDQTSFGIGWVNKSQAIKVQFNASFNSIEDIPSNQTQNGELYTLMTQIRF